MTQVRLNK